MKRPSSKPEPNRKKSVCKKTGDVLFTGSLIFSLFLSGKLALHIFKVDYQ